MLPQFSRICLNKLFSNSYNRHILIGTVKASTCPTKIYNHFSNNGQLSNLDLFPSDLKRITSKKDIDLYVADDDAANVIAKAIARFRMPNVPFFEVNPGPCILAKALLRHLEPKKLGLIEKNKEFIHIQQEVSQLHKSRILVNALEHHWYLYIRMANLIQEHSEKQQWHKDVVCQLFVYLKSSDFFRIISDVVIQRRLFANGRIDIFAIVPLLEFMRITANPDSKYWLYTQKSCLFQIFFEYELLAEFQKESFLPWFNPKPAYGGKIEYDTDLFYLVRMTPRRDLFSICSPGDLPLLRFFVNQCLFKRKGYVIPKLEQWIPGIGVDLITSKFKQSSHCKPNSTNFMQHLKSHTFHAFTECGSLTPLQMCALFQFVQKSPQYPTSCFHQQCKDFYLKSKIAALYTTTEDHGNSDDETG
ncbi:dimethyladenosine transferase 2, mitochondrial [Sitodiplosis mosellana]|uniref:dimethyladenosine transferase 2, mitochondrial n=1 Tax=Sitodiplosis mosellana TaxID=263140 RepID=UPI0024443200|nr:dimethyladenosine transferase 2, mitochondrial [Sitodiplosis mosellana]